MTRLQRNFIIFFKSRRLNIFLLFVVLALLFSVLTKLSRDYTQTISFQIQAVNVPEDKVIIKDSVHKLDISLTTYGFKLLRYYLTKPKVKVDIGNLDRTDEFYIWTENKEFSNVVAQFDPKVKIETINPDTLRFKYDTNGVKKVPVVFNANIEFLPGYDIVNNYVLQPDSVKIIGPNILIDTIDVIHTNELKLENINTNISTRIGLEFPANDQLRLSERLVNVTAEVERFTEGSIEVPVILRNVPDDVKLKIYPKNIEVIFYANLSQYKSIASNSFIVECDYNEALASNTTYLIPKITQRPEQVKNARLNSDRIEFIIVQ
ncbi:MAG: YbbR-like domain-containing protein [Bacteroidia bacterium]|nr:YbbR-like domain-containing protein [Bacteroidia bacterium]